MPIVTLTPESPTWTNNTGSDVLLTSIEATGPGQNGGGPQTTPGVGGASLDGEFGYGFGSGEPTQESPLGGFVLDPANSQSLFQVFSIPGSYPLGPYGVDVDFTMFGGGGSSSATAGGGSGGRVDGTIPAGETATLVVGGAGDDTTLSDNGSDFITAGQGTAASGDTPGDGGNSGDDVGWSISLTNGNPGTGPTLVGGDGGAGGNWASANLLAGHGGASVDSIAGAGRGADPGGVAEPGFAVIDAEGPVASGTYGPYGSNQPFALVGGGGASSATVGGGSGGKVEGTIPSGREVILIVGAVGQDTILYDSADDIEIGLYARAGLPAFNDTPGDGGSPEDRRGWSTVLTNGNPGTATGSPVTVSVGDVITLDVSNTGNTFLYHSQGPTLLQVNWPGGSPSGTDFPGGIATQYQGGLGGNGVAGTFSESGGGGGTAANSDGNGINGGEGVVPSASDGPDGVNPGDGGGGSGANASTGGLGQLGFAVITWEASEEEPDDTPSSGVCTILLFGSYN
jgi:collagen type III alpha